MATIKKCDRCGRVRPVKYFYVSLTVAEQSNTGDPQNEENTTVISDCCEHCLNTITKCVTLKKKPRKAKPRGNAKPRQRKPRKTTDASSVKTVGPVEAGGQAALPTPNGAPAKPTVPPPPEG